MKGTGRLPNINEDYEWNTIKKKKMKIQNVNVLFWTPCQ